jgi:hypothetical protein
MLDWHRKHGDEDDFIEFIGEIKKFEADLVVGNR